MITARKKADKMFFLRHFSPPISIHKHCTYIHTLRRESTECDWCVELESEKKCSKMQHVELEKLDT